jgi:TolB protein
MSLRVLVLLPVVLAVVLAGGSATGATSPLSDVGLIWLHGDRSVELWGMRVDGRGERPLWPVLSFAPELSIGWSPDGTRIAYFEPDRVWGRLYVTDTQTGRRSVLQGGSACGRTVSFSPDGRSVICEANPESERVYVVSGGQARLVDDDDGPGDEVIGQPAWGPNGLIAETGAGGLALFSLQPTLHLVRGLDSPPSDYNGNPAWSPDAHWIAFNSPDPKSRRDRIWIVGADGKHLRMLGLGDDPQFSPDGGWIAFDSDRSGDREIYVMRRDGSDVRRVTNLPGADYSPLWRPRSSQ